MLVSTACWAYGSFLQPRIRTPRDPLVLSFYEMLTGAVVLTVVGLLSGERVSDMGHASARSWWGVGLPRRRRLAVRLHRLRLGRGHAPLSLVSTYAYVNPVVAVLLGWWILGEPLTVGLLVGGAIVVVGVVLVVSGERTTRRPGGTVVRRGLPDRDPHAVLAVGADGEVDRVAGRDELAAARRRAAATRSWPGSRHPPALVGQRRLDPVALRDERSTRSSRASLRVERGERRRLRDGGDAERHLASGAAPRHRRVRDGEADPQAGEPVGLGERPQDRHVGALAVRRRGPRTASASRTNST